MTETLTAGCRMYCCHGVYHAIVFGQSSAHEFHSSRANCRRTTPRCRMAVRGCGFNRSMQHTRYAKGISRPRRDRRAFPEGAVRTMPHGERIGSLAVLTSSNLHGVVTIWPAKVPFVTPWLAHETLTLTRRSWRSSQNPIDGGFTKVELAATLTFVVPSDASCNTTSRRSGETGGHVPAAFSWCPVLQLCVRLSDQSLVTRLA